jgi:organic hydroperoxide reductase OsmC/OhrA
VGEVETEGRVLVIKRIAVRYRLTLESGKREVAERVHRVHMDHCPIARSIAPCIAITTSLELEEL